MAAPVFPFPASWGKFDFAFDEMAEDALLGVVLAKKDKGARSISVRLPQEIIEIIERICNKNHGEFRRSENFIQYAIAFVLLRAAEQRVPDLFPMPTILIWLRQWEADMRRDEVLLGIKGRLETAEMLLENARNLGDWEYVDGLLSDFDKYLESCSWPSVRQMALSTIANNPAVQDAVVWLVERPPATATDGVHERARRWHGIIRGWHGVADNGDGD